MKNSRFWTTATFIACVLNASTVVTAQDDVGTRDVQLTAPGDRRLQINQIDTSRFPRVDIFATVTENDQPVAGLTARDFKVREDEIEQEPIEVEARRSPLATALTIDTSGSMSKVMSTARDAAKGFVNALDAADTVAVISFNRSVRLISPAGTHPSDAVRAIDSLQARGDTALYDALFDSLSALKNTAGRKAVVLLSDGVDDDGHGRRLSKRTPTEALALAKELNIPVFTIGLGAKLDEALLRKVAAESGGMYFYAPGPEELAALYRKLGRQLSGQYHIFYSSSLPADGSQHTIQLAQGALRSVKGYVAPGEESTQRARMAAEELQIVGGTSFENAPSIPLNSTLTITNPATERQRAAAYVSFNAPSGARVAVVSNGVRVGGCPVIKILTSDLRERARQHGCTKNAPISVFHFVSHELSGKHYLQLDNLSSARLAVYTHLLEDAGAGRDAAGSETGAVEIAESAEIQGVVAKRLDAIDTYRVRPNSAGAFQVKARPVNTHALQVTMFDENGQQIAQAQSANNGAGVTLSYTLPAPTMLTIVVKPLGSSGPDYGSYALVAGPEGVNAPLQPSFSLRDSVLRP